MDLLVPTDNNDYGCCKSIQVLSLCCFWNVSHRIRWAKDNKENSKRNFIVTSNHINKWKTINQQPFWGSAHKHLFTNYINANMWRAPGGRNREIDRRHTHQQHHCLTAVPLKCSELEPVYSLSRESFVGSTMTTLFGIMGEERFRSIKKLAKKFPWAILSDLQLRITSLPLSNQVWVLRNCSFCERDAILSGLFLNCHLV